VLGAASLLSKLELHGRVRIILQPGEEVKDSAGKSGAARMIEYGALQDVSAILGLHVDSTVPASKIGVVSGAIAPTAQEFLIVVRESDHLDHSLDAALRASRVVQSLYELTPRMVTLTEPILLSVGSIHSTGDSYRTTVSDVTIMGLFKTFGDDMRTQVHAEIEKICHATGSTSVTFPPGQTTVLEGEFLTSILQAVAHDLIGADNVLSIKRRSWAADYSLYTELIPGAFIYLGAEIAKSRRIHHAATFDIDESGLYIAAAILAETAVRFLL
jgi:amidohydrolase